MTTPLPRAYWCHVNYTGSSNEPTTPAGYTTEFPGRALSWVRKSVRDMEPVLERAPFEAARARLGDHQGTSEAIRDLRTGTPYEFELNTSTDHWRWTAHLVSVLPLVGNCTDRACPTEEMTAPTCPWAAPPTLTDPGSSGALLRT